MVQTYKRKQYLGAAIYYLRHVLHDYSDEACKPILRILVDAMAEDSRVLISDMLLENPPTLREAITAMSMVNVAGKERTHDEFENTLEGTGLKIIDIHRDPMSSDVILECAKV